MGGLALILGETTTEGGLAIGGYVAALIAVGGAVWNHIKAKKDQDAALKAQEKEADQKLKAQAQELELKFAAEKLRLGLQEKDESQKIEIRHRTETQKLNQEDRDFIIGQYQEIIAKLQADAKEKEQEFKAWREALQADFEDLRQKHVDCESLRSRLEAQLEGVKRENTVQVESLRRENAALSERVTQLEHKEGHGL